MNRRLCLLAGFALVALGCHDRKYDEPSGLGVATGAIVNGTPEPGYPAVGALTQWQGLDYYGSFCTATLIRPTWVLTAAHCVEDASASQTRFYIGANANNPDNGEFVRALEFKVHEGYDARFLQDDIALVRLTEAVAGVTPIPYNISNIVTYEGDEAFYVGFGAVEGINESGSGIKRSTSFPITDVYSDSFDSQYNGHGTCFGDSGGPALFTISGEMRVIGVTSAGAACEGAGCDPCKTATTSTRVDAYAAWIADKLDEPAPSCKDNLSICSCDQACQADGSCDNSVCQVSSCSEAYDCMVDCGANGGCQEGCYNGATVEAQGQLDALFGCLETNCDPNLSESAYAECAQSKCGGQAEACFGGGPTPTGSDTCEQVYDCFGACQDQSCYNGCYAEGTAQAQAQVDAMLACFDSQCGTIDDENAWLTCVQDKCEAQLTTCFGAPESCNLLGGSCPDGTACYPTTTESFNGCFDTADKAVGAACNPDAADLECVDGAVCNDGTCVRWCTSNAACGDGTCDLEISGIAGIGICVGGGDVPCTDGDGDGACVENDCNDGDANVRPGAAEQCGNGKDDNCNNQTDEGCSSCIDGDGDGFCADVDCNDGDPTQNPGGTERCGDSTDNNCNSQTDEGCETCVDGDADGYCSDQDCNDQNTNVHPTLAETCANAIDDNCNGQTDEGCTTGPNNPPVGGNSSDGCAGGGELPLLAGLIALAFVVSRRRRA